jgi:hypothetical protein
MSFIPSSILSKLYTRTSLKNSDGAVCFSVKNRLAPVTLRKISRVEIDSAPIDLERVIMALEDGSACPVASVTAKKSVDFPLGTVLTFRLDIAPLEEGKHHLTVVFDTQPFGELKLAVSDALNTGRRAPGDTATGFGRRLQRRDHRLAAGLYSGAHGGHPRPRHALLDRPAGDARQHRALHRRRPGADGLCGPVAGPRPARSG